MICLFFSFGQILKFLHLLIARSPKNPMETLATPDGRRQFQGDTHQVLSRVIPASGRSYPRLRASSKWGLTENTCTIGLTRSINLRSLSARVFGALQRGKKTGR